MMLDAALAYAASGLCVFPCVIRSATPITRRGFYDATTNPATIHRWLGGPQEYNIAIRTGQASGVWVLDVDDENIFQELIAEHGDLPFTRQSKTSRGRHIWWRATAPLFCSAGRIAPHIDVRGDGGYAMAPPSIHASGHVYRWLNDEPCAVAPDWLVQLARKKPAPEPIRLPPRNHNGPPGAYGAAALEREIAALANTTPGSRNHALNRASFSLHQLVAGGELDAGEVERRLIEAATANGLTSDPNDGLASVMRTIASGRRAGLQHPRTRPGA